MVVVVLIVVITEVVAVRERDSISGSGAAVAPQADRMSSISATSKALNCRDDSRIESPAHLGSLWTMSSDGPS